MKKLLLSLALCLVFVTSASAQYTLKTLTFEDNDYVGTQANYLGYYNWSSLIDSPQYGGTLLYGANHGDTTQVYTSTNYKWYDQCNTYLYHELPVNYGVTMYWGGGHALSNYWDGNLSHGDYLHQLSVYVPNTSSYGTGGHGHNGSDNFCVHFGYSDDSGYSASNLPCILFNDGIDRTIDHMYVNITTYFANCIINGNNLTGNLGPNEYVRLKATGYNANGVVTGSTLFYIALGSYYINDWTKWNLYSLGNVHKVEFNMESNCTNGYGFSQPAYFAYDDVAVRFPNNNSKKSKKAPNGDNSIKSFRIICDKDFEPNCLTGDVPEGISYTYESDYDAQYGYVNEGQSFCWTIKNMPNNATIKGITVTGYTDGVFGKSHVTASMGDDEFASLKFNGMFAADYGGILFQMTQDETEMDMEMNEPVVCTDDLLLKCVCDGSFTQVHYFDIYYEYETSTRDRKSVV